MTILKLEEIAELVAQEEALSENVLHLTANETILSPFAQEVLASPLYNRYLLESVDMREDSPSRLGSFLFRGLNNINEIEKSAIEVCKEMFDAEYVEFRCLSGLHAMQTTLASLTRPTGTYILDEIMRFSTKDGGHFATEHLIKLFGRGYHHLPNAPTCCYAVDRDTLQIDLEKTLAFDPGHTIPFSGIYINHSLTNNSQNKKRLAMEIKEKLCDWGKQNCVKVKVWPKNGSHNNKVYTEPDLIVGINNWRCVLLKDRLSGKIYERR